METGLITITAPPTITATTLTLTNKTIDVGQNSIANSVISGGYGGFTGSWTWTSANLIGGGTNTWSTTNTLGTAIDANSCTSYNGYIYCPGGLIARSTPTTTVQYTKVLSSGVSGAWSTTNSLGTAIYDNSCTAYNGYIYCPGGENSGGLPTTPVQYAQVLSSGALGAWSTTANSLGTAVEINSCTSYKGYIYCPGGSGPGATVQYAQVLSNGQLGTSQTNKRTLCFCKRQCLHLLQRIHIGGNADGLSSTVQYAQVLSNGALGSWQTDPLAYGITFSGSCTSYNGYIYCPGGDINNAANALVQYSQVLGSGTLGTWQTTNSLTATTVDNSCVASNSYIYCPGGLIGGSTSTTVQYASVLSSSGTPFETLPIPSNAMTFTISAVNSITVNMIYSSNTYSETTSPNSIRNMDHNWQCA